MTKKLVFLAYLQIGIMQATSGFYTWMVVLNDYGFPPHILPFIDRGNTYGKRHCGYRNCPNLDPKDNGSHFGDIEDYMFSRLMAGELGGGEEDEDEDWW